MRDEQVAPFHSQVGGLLANLREQRGMSQEALAVQLGRDQSYVSRIESALRQPSLVVLLEWSDAMAIPFRELAAEIEALWESTR